MGRLKFVITGTGRCGTVYFAKLLTSLGIICGHETIFTYDGIEEAKVRLTDNNPLQVSLISEIASSEEEWFPNGVIGIQADSSYMVAPFLNNPILDGVKVIHLIRNPLEVINSFVYGLSYFKNNCTEKENYANYHKFIYKHVPRVLEYDHPMDRATAYYLEWNKLIETNTRNKSYLLHNIRRNLNKVFEFLDVGKPTKYYDNSRCNHICGLSNRLNKFNQIPSQELQNELMIFYNRYFYVKI